MKTLHIKDSFISLIKEMKLPYLRISLTNDCNASCKFCHNEGQKIGLRGADAHPVLSTLDEEQFIYIANFFQGMFSKIAFTGGEPTLVKNLPNIVKIFSDRGFKTHMTTNAFLLTEDLQIALKEAGHSHINISLHSLDHAEYANSFGVSGHLDNVLRNIETIPKHFPNKAKINFMAFPGENVPYQLTPISELSAKTGLVVSYLSLVKDRNFQELLSQKVLEHLRKNIGIENVKKYDDKFGSRYIYTLANGAQWEIDDFRRQEYRDAAFNNKECQSCAKQERCTEGPYALRITHTGTLKPCLIRDDNTVSLTQKGYNLL